MKKLIILLTLVVLFNNATAQKAVTRYFPAAATPSNGNENLQALLSAYLQPIMEDYGSVLNSGWVNTAATHKRFGFDLSITMNTITAKSSSNYFVPPNTPGLVFQATTANNDQAPTAYGPTGEYPRFSFTGTPGPGSNAGLQFLGADGASISEDIPVGSIMVPTIQGGLGLFASTDIRFRFTPNVTISGTELGNWGLGIHHDIKQHFGPLKELPFSLSVFAGYSQLKATTDLSGVYSGTDQMGEAKTTSITARLLISKKLAIFTFYGGVGYNSATTNFDIKGTYLVDRGQGIGGSPDVPLVQTVTLNNPFSQEFKSSGVSFTGGLRLNLGPVTLNGDYSLLNAEGLLTAGFGFTVR
ncbi:MAG: hypothetical protein JNL17_13555 [Cyclobacteriaceae bacterium]|nr:hypothetical protein [Cyclobacteriaceae bacterium]